MAIFVEVMYNTIPKGLTTYKRKRVGLEAATGLDRDNVLWVILSTSTTSARSRRIIDSVDYERAGEVRLMGTTDAALLCRHGGSIALTHAIGADFWFWMDEGDPKAAGNLASGVPVTLPRKTIVFNPPTVLPATTVSQALTQAEADLY